MSLIKCEDVSLRYKNQPVVDKLTFCINSGDFLCILGENGSGKSTLIRSLLGLKKPSFGKIEYGDGLKKRDIGYLPQQTEAQRDFPASSLEVVISGFLGKRGLIPFYSKEQKRKALENLKRLGIDDLANHCYRELSGGQQQRVLLARALCASSKLILLDEPTTALDPKVADEFYSLIKKLNDEGVTVVMVTHDVKAAIAQATHILQLSRTPKFFGRVSDYVQSDVGKAFIRKGGARC